MRRFKTLTDEVDRGKVESKGEGSGEGVDDTLLSNTVFRYISLTDIDIGWGLLR